MYGYIYETTNLINGKKYIGKKVSNIFVNSYYGSGILLKKAIRKYGKNNFKVVLLDEAYNNIELNEKEKFYINKYNATKSDLYYNIAEGGEGGNLIMGYTDEQYNSFREKVSINTKLAMKNYSFSNEQRFKMGSPNRNKNISTTVRNKISKSLKGRPSKLKGIPLSDEHKRNISKSSFGKPPTIKGRKAINNGIINKYVPVNELDLYLNQGWTLGLK